MISTGRSYQKSMMSLTGSLNICSYTSEKNESMNRFGLGYNQVDFNIMFKNFKHMYLIKNINHLPVMCMSDVNEPFTAHELACRYIKKE
ncbi:hypothetical protein KC19_9G168600 [Ceratodon purpureus]|uniref:Uncharacterized protein n=1 Tax=Ceratodon purpureus TaxID=3225 RepID=A0A8T0GXB3_CERPU|nr:hypothetical protein KC19_9G168600 [Ceratodon purpureus]